MTYTQENGWHPHYHVLLFLERRPLSPAEVGEIEGELREIWQKSLSCVDGFADLEHGVTVKSDHIFEIADYITSKTSGNIADYAEYQGEKGAEQRLNGDEWGISEEVTKTHLKEAHRGGKSPNQLLMDYLWGDKHAGRLWKDYAEVFKGKKFLDSTPGLRAKLDELKEQYEDDLDELRQQGELEQVPEWQALAHLGPEAFKQVVRYQIIQWLLAEVRESKGDANHIKGFLEDFEITQVYYPTLDAKLPDWMVAGPDPPPDAVEKIRELNDFIAEYNSEGL